MQAVLRLLRLNQGMFVPCNLAQQDAQRSQKASFFVTFTAVTRTAINSFALFRRLSAGVRECT